MAGATVEDVAMRVTMEEEGDEDGKKNNKDNENNKEDSTKEEDGSCATCSFITYCLVYNIL